MQKADKIRLLVFPTAFGTLWGLIELLAGGWLHVMHVPLSGAYLGAIGAIILCAERAFTPVRGATLYTGLTAILIKSLAIGGVQARLNTVIALALETAMAEIVLSVLGVGVISFFITPLLCAMENAAHFFVNNWIKYGGDVFGMYAEIFHKMQPLFGLKPDSWKMFVAVWLAAHLVIGVAAGFVSVRVGKYLRKL